MHRVKMSDFVRELNKRGLVGLNEKLDNPVLVTWGPNAAMAMTRIQLEGIDENVLFYNFITRELRKKDGHSSWYLSHEDRTHILGMSLITQGARGQRTLRIEVSDDKR